MQATFYGHACLKVRSAKGAIVLMDPWFSRHGAFFGSWFQFPENTPLLDEALEDVNDICLSHNHFDHFDPSVLLSALSKNSALKLHIARFQTKWFVRRASRLLQGFEDRIIEHLPYEQFSIGGDLTVFFVPEESPGEIDSAIVCKTDNGSVVNLNDSRLSSDQLLRIGKIINNVDFLCLQASGASEYPICYTYRRDEMVSLSIKKRRDKIDHCKKIIDVIQPARIFFFAGPPVFLEKSLDKYNQRTETSVFPDQLDIVREIESNRPDIAEKTLFLLPGEELLDTYLWKNTDLRSQRLFPYREKEQYIAAYRERRKDVCTFDWGDCPDDDSLHEHFQKMTTLSPYISGYIGGEITFIIKGSTSEKIFTINFPNGEVQKGATDKPLYILTVPASSVIAVLKAEATWDDIFLSCRMRFDERGEHFVPHYKPLLRYMDRELLDKLEHYEAKINGIEDNLPMIDVSFGGKTFRIQRFCPHAGTDLEVNGRVDEDGTITCLAHRLCFDLRTGECRNARGYSLRVESRPMDVCGVTDSLPP